MDAPQRASLALSSMYSVVDGRADDGLDGNSWWIRQASWNMLRGAWEITGRTIAQKHDKAVSVLAWLRDQGDRAEARDPASSADLLAWDVARLVHVARRCRHARFLDQGEAWAFVLDGGGRARAGFTGWAEYAAAFLRGRELWAGEPDALLSSAVEQLLSDPQSIWSTTDWAALPARSSEP
jgi:Protein of unknown function (DUF1266)